MGRNNDNQEFDSFKHATIAYTISLVAILFAFLAILFAFLSFLISIQ